MSVELLGITLVRMITTSDLNLSFSSKTLFQSVNIKFLPGNCYGLIGANGAGKSTLLKVISGEILPTEGSVILDKNLKLSVLKQDQFAYDSFPILDTVIMGYKALYDCYKRRMDLYAKGELSEKEGEEIGELEDLYAEMDGYRFESDAARMLCDLGIGENKHDLLMSEMQSAEKLKILLAQALFAEPDILLLDEPTNQLDYHSILWLEEYLLNFKNTVIVVSHDRHFLNKVCTHIADVDYGQVRIYPGNYDFWKEASELVQKQRNDKADKDAKKIEQLESFVRRFSANASKSKQATSRKKLIEKLRPEELPVSTRRAPFIDFKAKRSVGNRVMTIKGLNASIEEKILYKDLNFEVSKGDKIAIISEDSLAKTALLAQLGQETETCEGVIKIGESVTMAYCPKNNNSYFENDLSLLDWLQQYSQGHESQVIRGFLGRMLFSGEEVNKRASVLSGGEKARAMFSKMMLKEPNTLIFEEPTDHLDLESISALNSALEQYNECIIFCSHDMQLLNTVANRIIEIFPTGYIDHRSNFEEYLNNPNVQKKRLSLMPQ